MQLKIREEEIADEAMPVARYFTLYEEENAMSQQWNTSLVLSVRVFFGWFSTVNNNFFMLQSARKGSTTLKGTREEET